MKGMTWAWVSGFSRSSYGKHFMDGLGLTSQTLLWPAPPPFFYLRLFRLLYRCLIPLFCVHVLIPTFWGAGLSSRPVPRVVGSCWKGVWAWAWVCQTPNSVLLCWLLFFWSCLLHSACFFLWAFNEVPRRRSSLAMALLGLGRGP